MPAYKRVSDIKSSLLRPSTTSHFEVSIPIPAPLRNKLSVNQPKLNLLCSEAALPGSSLATLDVQNDRTGVTERHVHRRIYDETIDLSFYVDAGFYTPIKFFEAWMDLAVNQDSTEAINSNYFYRMAYPDDYMKEGLTVTKFEKDYAQALTYQFIKSYPLQITSMPPKMPGKTICRQCLLCPI